MSTPTEYQRVAAELAALRARAAGLAAEWDRETGPGYRHPHAIQLRDLLTTDADS